MAGIIDTVAAVPLNSANLTTVVVGSAARAEWVPSSDVDVWLLREHGVDYKPVVSAIVAAAKPTCKIDVMVGTAPRFLGLAYEECHIATSFLDAQFVVGNNDIFTTFSALRTQLLADSHWVAFFLRSLRRDCQLMAVRNPTLAVGSSVKFSIGGRMFLDNAIAASIVSGQPISDALTTAKAYFLTLRTTTDVVTADALTEFTTYSNSVIAECTRLFGYVAPPSTWAQTEKMRQTVRDASMANVSQASVIAVHSGDMWQQISESKTRFAAGYAFAFALEDAGKLDQWDALWPLVETAIFAVPQLSSIQSALSLVPA